MLYGKILYILKVNNFNLVLLQNGYTFTNYNIRPTLPVLRNLSKVESN